MKKTVAAAAIAAMLPLSAHAATHHKSAYHAALNVGLGGDWYGPRPSIPGNKPPSGGWQPPSWGGPSQTTRVYLMRGLGHLSNFAPLKRDLEATGAHVSVYGWASRREIVRDAMRHRGDRIIVGGHSQGDKSAFVAGADLQRRGVPVHVIGMDPLCTFPKAAPGLWSVNIWGNYCGSYPGTVSGSENIYRGGIGHVVYPTDSEVRYLFVQATYWH